MPRFRNTSRVFPGWGLLLALLAVPVLIYLRSQLSFEADDVMAEPSHTGVLELDSVSEASAIQQLADGRVLVVEDEAFRAFQLLSVAADGRLMADRSGSTSLTRSFGRSMDDLEGLSIDDNDWVYAITSHSLNRDYRRKGDREQLLRFRIEGSSARDLSIVTTLRDALAGAEDLKTAIRDKTGEGIDFHALDIEGLVYDNHKRALLLGLRAPVVDGLSVIIPIRNPAEMFVNRSEPSFGDPILLDLGGGGIRALDHDPVLGAFLIVNEVENDAGDRQSRLWLWSGLEQATAEPVDLPAMASLKNIESVDSVSINGEPRLLIMNDSGGDKRRKPTRYMIFSYDRLAQ